MIGRRMLISLNVFKAQKQNVHSRPIRTNGERVKGTCIVIKLEGIGALSVYTFQTLTVYRTDGAVCFGDTRLVVLGTRCGNDGISDWKRCAKRGPATTTACAVTGRTSRHGTRERDGKLGTRARGATGLETDVGDDWVRPRSMDTTWHTSSVRLSVCPSHSLSLSLWFSFSLSVWLWLARSLSLSPSLSLTIRAPKSSRAVVAAWRRRRRRR